MLITNTIRYGTDEFVFNKTMLTYNNAPLDCTKITQCDGLDVSGTQPNNTDRRAAFKVDGTWYKLSGNGNATLLALATQTLTPDSVLADGNTVAELQAATSIPGFVGKNINIAIALIALGDVVEMPTLKINGIKIKSNQEQTARTEVSAPMLLSAEMVDVVDLSALVTASGGATANVSVSLQQNSTWSDYMPLATARRQKATSLKFKADYSVASIGTGSAKVERVTASYRSNNAVVSGDTAEIVSVTEDFGGVGMRFGRISVKHQALKDAQLRALMAMRPMPKTRERIPVTVGNGQRQTVILGTKDSNGVVQPDAGINHNTLRLWHGSQEIFDFDFNTEMSQASTTAPEGVTVFTSYSYGWEPEVWQEMTRGITQTHDDPNTCSTEFTYVLPSGQLPKGVAAVKVLLEKPGGTVTNKALGIATGKTQMFVLDHAAKLASIVVVSSGGSASWNYDESSRILTVVAPKDATMAVSYDWVAETPTCYGFVACWNE